MRIVEDLVELLGRVALLAVELSRDDDVKDDELVAAAAAAERRQALAREQDVLPGLSALRHRDLVHSVERRDLDRAAEHGARDADLRGRDEVLAVALEAVVAGDGDLDVEVAGRRAGIARMALPGDPNPLAGLDAGRNVDLVRPLSAQAPRPSQASQGSSGILPSPLQVGHADWRIIWPNGVRVTCCTAPCPPQVSQVRIGVPGSAPFPWQCSQRVTALERNLPLRAREHLGQVDLRPTRRCRRRSRGRGPPKPKMSPKGELPPPKIAEKMSSIPPDAACEEKPSERSPSWPNWS